MARIYASIFICITCFACGWVAHGWKNDSEDLAASKAVHEAEKKIADNLEKKLSEIKTNERVIIREIPKIIDRPVYSNECLDSDGLLLINRAKAGPAKPAG